jgi:hypothetical protein
MTELRRTNVQVVHNHRLLHLAHEKRADFNETSKPSHWLPSVIAATGQTQLLVNNIHILLKDMMRALNTQQQ